MTWIQAVFLLINITNAKFAPKTALFIGQAIIKYPFDTYNLVVTSVWQLLCDVAANGDMVTYSILKGDGTVFTDSDRHANSWFLIRFPE
jgi:hypothetical protein